MPVVIVTFVEGLLGPRFAKFAKPLIVSALGLLILLALWGGKCAYDKHVVTGYQQQQQQRAAPATEQATQERAQQVPALQQKEQEMHHDVAVQPDQPIAPTSRAHGCDQLRRAGRSVAACR